MKEGYEDGDRWKKGMKLVIEAVRMKSSEKTFISKVIVVNKDFHSDGSHYHGYYGNRCEKTFI